MPLKPARLVPAVTAAARAAGNQLINNYRKFLLAYERHHRPRDLPAPPTSEVRGHVTPPRDTQLGAPSLGTVDQITSEVLCIGPFAVRIRPVLRQAACCGRGRVSPSCCLERNQP